MADGYRPTESVWTGARGAREAWLWVEVHDARVVVDRLPGDAAYPIRTGPGRLFTLAAGQLALYRANFRFAGPARWFYEQWTVHCAYAPARPDLFRDARYTHDIDECVSLYG